MAIHSANSSSPKSVKRRKKKFQLYGSRSTAKQVSTIELEQIVLDQVGKDLSLRHGVRAIQQKILYDQGVHVRRYGDLTKVFCFVP